MGGRQAHTAEPGSRRIINLFSSRRGLHRNSLAVMLSNPTPTVPQMYVTQPGRFEIDVGLVMTRAGWGGGGGGYHPMPGTYSE